jgi:hypothetical protein
MARVINGKSRHRGCGLSGKEGRSDRARLRVRGNTGTLSVMTRRGRKTAEWWKTALNKPPNPHDP